MDLLFKREQGTGTFGRVIFKLWAKSEFTEDERALLDRYRLDQARLLDADDTGQLKWAAIIAIIAFFPITSVTYVMLDAAGLFLGILGAIGVGFWYFNEKRETLFVKDLLYGRRFKCKSIGDLARKEAWIENACLILRQTLETAKHWDGVETNPIPVLEKEEAKKLVIQYAWNA